jgi:hypothetical protein
VAYVFLDLLPDLAEQQSLIDHAGLFPGLDTDRSGDAVAFATAATVYGVLLLSLSPAG